MGQRQRFASRPIAAERIYTSRPLRDYGRATRHHVGRAKRHPESARRWPPVRGSESRKLIALATPRMASPEARETLSLPTTVTQTRTPSPALAIASTPTTSCTLHALSGTSRTACSTLPGGHSPSPPPSCSSAVAVVAASLASAFRAFRRISSRPWPGRAWPSIWLATFPGPSAQT